MLVHSFLYYQLNVSIVSDMKFDSWARELVALQKKFPNEGNKVHYHKEFANFDGSSGFDLPYNRPEVQDRALRVLKYHNGREFG